MSVDEIFLEVIKAYVYPVLKDAFKKTQEDALSKYTPLKYKEILGSNNADPSHVTQNVALVEYMNDVNTPFYIRMFISSYEEMRICAEKEIETKILEGLTMSIKKNLIQHKDLYTYENDENLKKDFVLKATVNAQSAWNSLFILSPRAYNLIEGKYTEIIKKHHSLSPQLKRKVMDHLKTQLDSIKKITCPANGKYLNQTMAFYIGRIKLGKEVNVSNYHNPKEDFVLFERGYHGGYRHFTVGCPEDKKSVIKKMLESKYNMKGIKEVDYSNIKFYLLDVKSKPKSPEEEEELISRQVKEDFNNVIPLWYSITKEKMVLAFNYADIKKGKHFKLKETDKDNAAQLVTEIKSSFKDRSRYTMLITKDKKKPGTKKCCEDKTFCDLFYDKEHMENFTHPHVFDPCEDIVGCANTNTAHISETMHICKYGGSCKDLENKEHLAHYVHIKPTCQNPSCTDTSAEHLVLEHGCIKRWCTDTKCGRQDPEHMKEFLHGPLPEPPVSFSNLLTEGWENPPDFDENVRKWMESTREYLKCNVAKENKEFARIAEWFRGFKDVHQCSLSALKSIKEIGAIASLAVLEGTWKSVDDIARLVWMRPVARGICDELYKDEKGKSLHAAQRLVKAYCRVVQGERSKENVKQQASKQNTLYSFTLTFQ